MQLVDPTGTDSLLSELLLPSVFDSTSGLVNVFCSVPLVLKTSKVDTMILGISYFNYFQHGTDIFEKLHICICYERSFSGISAKFSRIFSFMESKVMFIKKANSS